MATRKPKATPAAKAQEKVAPKPASKTAAKPAAKPAAKTTAPRKTARKAPAKAPARPAAKRAPAKKAAPARKKPAPAPVKVDDDAATPDDGDLMGLTPREAKFVDLYLIGFNGERSYIEAGFGAKAGPSAQAAASRLLGSVKVKHFLAKQIKGMIARTEQQQDTLMRSLTLQAFADARELVEHHKGSCRYCWGKLHRYQYTAGEWDALMTKHAERQEKAAAAEKPLPEAPDPKGGTGYLWGKEPNPDCPECSGHGLGKTIIHDTRNLSPAAAAIFAGVKEGKDGIEVKIRDQGRALDTLVKIAKLYEDATNINVSVDASALEASFGEAMRKSHERMEAMRRERGLDGSKPEQDD